MSKVKEAPICQDVIDVLENSIQNLIRKWDCIPYHRGAEKEAISRQIIAVTEALLSLK